MSESCQFVANKVLELVLTTTARRMAYGFIPRFADLWDKGNWSGGCIRRNSLKCDSNGTNDGFLEVEKVKLLDFADTLATVNLGECEGKCKNNCSCNAYAYVSGIRCMVWSDDLVDVEYLAGGNTLYLRVANSELGGKRKISNITIIIIAVLGTIILGVIFWALWRFREKRKIRNPWEEQNNSVLTSVNRSQEISTALSGTDELDIEGKQGNGPQLPLFSFHYVELAKCDCFVLMPTGGGKSLCYQVEWKSYVAIVKRKAISYCWRFSQ